MSRVVVTGGAGFLGSHLCEALLDRGDEVVCFDNLVTGSADNIAPFLGRDGFQFVRHDVTQQLWVTGPVDRVMHLASPASPVDFARIPIEILDVGSIGTRNCLELCREKGARFFLNSTSEVYGDPLVHPQPETYWGNVNPNGPRSVYDEAKRFAEALTMAYHRQQGVDTAIVRIFNTYGPRMRAFDGRAIPTFLRQALLGQPLTVFGEGSQTRSFCYVDDLIAGIWRLAISGEHEPVNIGNPEEFTLLQLAAQVITATGSDSRIVFESLPENDPAQRRPDITRAKTLLGWDPAISLEEGLRMVLERSARHELIGRTT